MKKLLILIFLFSFILQSHAEKTAVSVIPDETASPVENFSIKQEVFIEGIGNVDLQEIADQAPVLFSSEVLPSSFDATKKGWITPVKNQEKYGTCWAFSTLSAMETNLIKKGYETKDSVDFSELHLAYFTHTKNQKFGDGIKRYHSTLGYYGGGDTTYASNTLVGWQGAAYEKDFPFPPPTIDHTLPENERYTSVAHLQSYNIIPRNKDLIKKAILEHGSVSVCYHDNKNFYSYDISYYQTSSTTPNHAVTIVGWDDNYALSNFDELANMPKAPGAWKIKNSWGPVRGDNGYFWISYEDPSLSYFTSFDVEKADNYHIIHQYDGGNQTRVFNGQASANVFTAEENQTLNAIGFYTCENNVVYTAKIYKLLASCISPETDTCITSVSGHEPYYGYHTVKLENPVSLKKGEKFSVVIELSNDLHTFEGPSASSNPNESFFSKNGIWLTNYVSNNLDTGTSITANNACIKAYSCKEMFTVSFNSNGGTDIEPLKIYSGFLSDIPPNPQKDNYYFAGWYKDSDFIEEWDFETDMITENTTLYAKWSDTPILMESIELSTNKPGVYINEKMKLSVKIKPYYATDTTLSWTRPDSSITISDGEISGNKKGTYAITATSTNTSNVSAECTINIYEPLKDILVQVQKPVHKTTDSIYYLVSAENAVSYDFYIETPEKKYIVLKNTPTVFPFSYSYTEGQHKICAIAYDALGNTLVSSKKTFWITDNPMLIAQKTNSGFKIGGYNHTDSKLMAAFYNENELISVSFINVFDKLAEISNIKNATTLKVIWLDSLNNLIPVTGKIEIENPEKIPVSTTFITQ